MTESSDEPVADIKKRIQQLTAKIDAWSTTNDGKTVSRELDKIYFDNMIFMKRFQ